MRCWWKPVMSFGDAVSTTRHRLATTAFAPAQLKACAIPISSSAAKLATTPVWQPDSTTTGSLLKGDHGVR